MQHQPPMLRLHRRRESCGGQALHRLVKREAFESAQPNKPSDMRGEDSGVCWPAVQGRWQQAGQRRVEEPAHRVRRCVHSDDSRCRRAFTTTFTTTT